MSTFNRNPHDDKLPLGTGFLDLMWHQEDECESVTDQHLTNLGKSAPECLQAIGTVLSYLDRLGTCWWGCREGDHLIEYLIVRAANCARASLRLLRFGFYDEALSLIRSVGEIANLFALFAQDNAALVEWREADRNTRIRAFGPRNVRDRLTKVNSIVPIDAEHYQLLCEIATHVTPETIPQAQDLIGIGKSGGFFQTESVLLVLNEVAFPLVFVCAFSTKLLELDPWLRDEVITARKQLLETIGNITLKDWPVLRDSLRSLPEVQEVGTKLHIHNRALHEKLRLGT